VPQILVQTRTRLAGVDPETGFDFDDTKRYIDQVKNLNDEQRYKIFEGNARNVYPRLDKLLTARGHKRQTF
jgi:4-oxalmesaconate hydratase